MLYSWRTQTPKDSSAKRLERRAMPSTRAVDTLTREVMDDADALAAYSATRERFVQRAHAHSAADRGMDQPPFPRTLLSKLSLPGVPNSLTGSELSYLTTK
jgi:hypothetical protein